MKKTLSKKIIIVSGGNGLLGKSIISDIKSHDGIPINLDLNHETSLDVLQIKCDITNKESIDKAIELIIKKYKKIDGLVNAAYPRTKDWGNDFFEIKLESLKHNLDIQLASCFYLTQQAVKHLIKNKNGSIINIGSIYGELGPDFNIYKNTEMTMPAGYSIIKGGVINFTRYLASFLGRYNIRCNCVSPGGIFDNQNKLFVKQYEEKVPLNRMGLSSDISPLISFLLSDDSKYITGQNINVDGGWSII
jgi:NAD(P)-dependent dehydrogenase (short-subunit alcohol dehydrogenase family)